ncbi:olfactory receptor 7A5-like [Lynx rufus]|uniref:olfactory receptor 7A5-like n=1 Tax=Lynx rufus TaxID=61384 RepID=UPI001F12694F|nr:olfactory receptor 7A5-like [Lynx rufus]
MEPGNQTRVSEFILLGFSEKAELQPLLFRLFLSMYLVTVFGNLLIILAITSDSHLYIPMCFFLANLPSTDICFPFTTVPKMLLNFQTWNDVFTYVDCIIPVYSFLPFGELDNFFLTVMAYDQFVAIYHPLCYGWHPAAVSGRRQQHGPANVPGGGRHPASAR